MQKYEPIHRSYNLHKINSKQTKDINVKCNTIKNRRKYDLVFGYKCLGTIPKSPFIKEKIYFVKTKNFCSVKETFKRVKHKAQTGRKYLQITYLIKDFYPKDTKNS